MRVKILPERGGGGVTAAQLAQTLMRQANDPSSALRAAPGLQGVQGALLVPKGKNADEVLNEYLRAGGARPAGAPQHQTGPPHFPGTPKDAEEAAQGVSLARPRIRTAREVVDFGGANPSTEYPLPEPETPYNSRPIVEGEVGLLSPQGGQGSSAGSLGRSAALMRAATDQGAEGGPAAGVFETEAQRKAWSAGPGGLMEAGGEPDGKSIRMRIRTARDIADSEGAEAAEVSWAAGDGRGADNGGEAGAAGGETARSSRSARSGPKMSKSEIRAQAAEQKFEKQKQDEHNKGVAWLKENRGVRTDIEVTATHLTNPGVVPEGWVQIREKSGRTSFQTEEQAGAFSAAIVKRDDHIEPALVSSSDDEDEEDESEEEYDGDFRPTKLRDEEEEGAGDQTTLPAAMTRIGTMFMGDIQINTEMK